MTCRLLVDCSESQVNREGKPVSSERDIYTHGGQNGLNLSPGDRRRTGLILSSEGRVRQGSANGTGCATDRSCHYVISERAH